MAIIAESKTAPPPTLKPTYRYQIYATILASLSILSCGFHYAWPSPNLPKLFASDSPIKITDTDGSWLAIAPALSGIVGAFVAAYVVDWIGRKYSVITTIPFYIASWVFIGIADSFTGLMVGRLFGGFADGITYTAVPIYVGEIASKNIRGILGSFITVIIIASQLLLNGVAPYVSIRLMSTIIVMVPIAQLILSPWIVESPHYYLMKNDFKSARQSLVYLRNTEDVDKELNEIREGVRSQMEERGSFKDLVLQRGNRKALLICMGLRTSQQLSGVSSILFYIQYIFSLIQAPISSVTTTIIFQSIQLVLCTCSSLLMDKVGRKILYLISAAGCAITLAITGTYFYLLTETEVLVSQYYLIPIAAMCSYIFSFSIGMAVIPVTMLSELFPANVKAKALAFMDAYFSFIVCIITKLFQILKDEYGIFVPFYIFSVCCVGGVIFSLYLPETKEKSLEEIQIILRTKKKGITNLSYDTSSHM